MQVHISLYVFGNMCMCMCEYIDVFEVVCECICEWVSVHVCVCVCLYVCENVFV